MGEGSRRSLFDGCRVRDESFVTFSQTIWRVFSGKRSGWMRTGHFIWKETCKEGKAAGRRCL